MKERGNRLYKNLDKYLGIPLTIPSGLMRKIFRRRDKNILEKRIGVICLGAIGDLLMASGLINGLREKLPEAELELVTSTGNAVAAPLIPGLNAVRSFKVSEVVGIIRHLRDKKFDLLFDTTQWARIGNIISNFSGAGETIGFQTRGQYRSFGYDIRVSHSDKIHEVDNFINLGKARWKDFTGKPGLRLPVELLNPPSGENIYLHMWCMTGPYRKYREWPEENWVSLIHFLIDAGYKVNLTGSEINCQETEDFLHKFHLPREKVKNLAGKASLSELAWLFTRSRGVVSVNTGTMHLASLLDVKVVALNGPTNVMRMGAYGKNSLCLTPDKGNWGYLNLGFEYPRNPENVMCHIPVEKVLAAMKKTGIIT